MKEAATSLSRRERSYDRDDVAGYQGPVVVAGAGGLGGVADDAPVYIPLACEAAESDLPLEHASAAGKVEG